MNIKRIVINLFFVIVCGLVLTGCNGKSDDVGTNELVNELEEVFNEVFANLDLENITEDIALPEQIGDVTFNWVSSDRNILSNDGKVNRVSVDKETTIKAFVIKGDAIKEFSKQITVKGRSVDDYIDFINNVFVDEVYGNIDLPKKAYDLEIIWSSSNSDVLTSAGKVKRERDDTEVVLTASFNYNGIEKKLEKNIIVKGTFNLEDYLSDVLDTILVDPSIKKLEDNLVLPLLVQGEYIIEWSIDEKYSSNARIEYTDDGRQMIVITRPEVGESYFNFELTATINKGLTKVSRIWTDCYVKPKPAVPNAEIEEVFDLPQKSKVCVEGTVTYVNGIHGFWIEDETGTLYVYVNQEHSVEVGDIVSVIGEKDLYYSLLEIKKPLVEIIRKGEYNYQNNLINSSVNELADSVPEKMEYTKEAISVQGKFYKVSGRVIDDPNGKYTYAISDDLTGKSIVVYDSALEEAVLNKVGSLKGKYIECVVLFYDFYSTGFARVIPILETIKEVEAPEMLTISEIKKNPNKYTNDTYLNITARVVRVVGDNLFLQDLFATKDDKTGETYFESIFMFSGYGSGLGRVDAGKVISFECQCTINEIYGTQLTNPKKVRIVQNDDEPYITELDSTKNIELGHYEGYVVSIKGLKVVNVRTPNDEGAYTISCETVTGQKIIIKIDGDVNPKYPYSEVEVGATYDVIGGVSKYGDSFQIILANQKGIAENDFVKQKK